MLEYFQNQQHKIDNLEELNSTAREEDIAQTLVKGLSDKEIVGKPFISVETLNSHKKSIYKN